MMTESACHIFVETAELVWCSIFDSQYEYNIRQRAHLTDDMVTVTSIIFQNSPTFPRITIKFSWWPNKYKMSDRLAATSPPSITGDKFSIKEKNRGDHSDFKYFRHVMVIKGVKLWLYFIV